MVPLLFRKGHFILRHADICSIMIRNYILGEQTMKKRVLSFVFVLALVLSLCPGTVFAASSGEGKELVVKEVPFQVNPLYADVIDPSDFKTNSGYTLGSGSSARAGEYLSEEETAKVMREEMEARNELFTIYVASEQTDLEQLVVDLFNEACAHTGNPTEGDYLMFQWAGYSYSISYYPDSFEYTIECEMAYYTTAEQEQQVDARIDTLMASLDLDGLSNYEKLLSIYGWICDNVTYDFDHLSDPDYYPMYTAYAALIDGTAVCQGYANLLYRMALEAGVDSRIIPGMGGSGSSMEPHVWNIAKAGGLYYNLDSTWDAGYDEYLYFMRCATNFPEHERKAEYETAEFHAAYPIGTTDYDPENAPADDPVEDPTEPPVVDPGEKFVDVESGAFYYEPVAWAVHNGITQGVDDTHFAPGDDCTRGQIVTFLWRAAGEPESASSVNPFKDVKKGSYCYDAVLWAVENGITNGMGDGTFGTDEMCTRAQVVTFLWRYAGKPTPAANSNPFVDVASANYFYVPVLWAVENGITNGMDATHFAPDDSCTRGQIVTFLYRAIAQ